MVKTICDKCGKEVEVPPEVASELCGWDIRWNEHICPDCSLYHTRCGTQTLVDSSFGIIKEE